MKTAAGSRVLVVPTAIMELFRVAIEAFHTDPETGAVDPTARLVPGPLKADRSGQIAYRRAFDDAANDEHLGSADLGFRVSSHLLRKSLATDLELDPQPGRSVIVQPPLGVLRYPTRRSWGLGSLVDIPSSISGHHR
jgi:hypothetical protein